MVKPIPDGFHTLTPHIVTNKCSEALEFYKKAFGAEEIERMPGPDGTSVLHAEMKIGDSVIMLADEFPGRDGPKAPSSLRGTTTTLHLYVKDVDQAFQRALDAGAETTMPVMDMFWGDRYGRVKDPFGHQWSLATHKEDLTLEQITENAQKFFAENPGFSAD